MLYYIIMFVLLQSSSDVKITEETPAAADTESSSLIHKIPFTEQDVADKMLRNCYKIITKEGAVKKIHSSRAIDINDL